MVLIIGSWDRWNLRGPGAGRGRAGLVFEGTVRLARRAVGQASRGSPLAGKLFYVSGSLLWNPHSSVVELHLPHWPHALRFKASL